MLIMEGSVLRDGEGKSYVLDKLIGSGGYGRVFKANRECDGEVVAVKVLSSSFDDMESLLSFQKELHQAKIIESQYIIKYHYIHDGSIYDEYPPYIIMEYSNEGTLSDYIREQKEKNQMIDVDSLKQLFLQLATGMDIISKVLVHRDIKPENILIINNTLKITDFGLSKVRSEDTQTLTFKGYGTEKYAAPEAWSNDKNTIQMDIYSMGIVYYELATLNYPYSIKNQHNSMEYRDAHLYQNIKNPSLINPNLPQGLLSVIIRMLEKPAQKRFRDWQEIIEAIQIKPLPEDNMKDFVEIALRTRNESDTESNKRTSEERKRKEEKENLNELIYSQFENDILKPVSEFISLFNSHYAGTMKYELKSGRFFVGDDKFTSTIITPSNKVTISMKIVITKPLMKKIEADRMFKDKGYRLVEYIPQLYKRDILAWGQVKDNNDKGFNIVLTKSKESLYGDWFVMNNTNSGLGKTKRPEPFGFSLEELPEEIEYIGAVHIFNTKVKPLETKDLIEYLSIRA